MLDITYLADWTICFKTQGISVVVQTSFHRFLICALPPALVQATVYGMIVILSVGSIFCLCCGCITARMMTGLIRISLMEIRFAE